MGNTYALEIRNKPSNSGGVWVCCPVLRKSITLENLSEAEVKIEPEYGISFENMFVHEAFVKWFDPTLPENILRSEAESEDGLFNEEVKFKTYLWENFYSHNVIRSMANEMREAATLIRSGRLQEVPYQEIIWAFERGGYEREGVADFYERFAGCLKRMLTLDEDIYMVAFWGP